MAIATAATSFSFAHASASCSVPTASLAYLIFRRPASGITVVSLFMVAPGWLVAGEAALFLRRDAEAAPSIGGSTHAGRNSPRAVSARVVSSNRILRKARDK